MTKLLEIREEIKKWLVSKDEYVGDPFGIKLSRYIDQYIRNMDGFKLVTPTKTECKKTYLIVDGMIVDYQNLVRDCIFDFYRFLSFGSEGILSSTENFCNYFEVLVKQECSFFESLEKRAECALVFLENKLKGLYLEKITFFEMVSEYISEDTFKDFLSNLEAGNVLNIPDTEFGWKPEKKTINIRRESLPFSEVYKRIIEKRGYHWNTLEKEEEQSMTKLLEIREEIKKRLMEYNEIYAKYYTGIVTPEIQAMCDSVTEKLTPHVDGFIDELAKENDYCIYSHMKREENKKPALGELLAQTDFTKQSEYILVLGFLGPCFGAGYYPEDVEKVILFLEKVSIEKYPRGGSAEERAEYMLNYFMELMKSFFVMAKKEGRTEAMEKFFKSFRDNEA